MTNATQERKTIIAGWLRYLIAGGFFVFLISFLWIYEKVSLETPVKIEIETGSTLGEVAYLLRKKEVINSESIFNVYALITRKADLLKAGTYVFEGSESIPQIMKRLVQHDTQENRVEVTFPEGFTREEMASVFATKYSNIREESFMEETRGLEGYLFPNTYTFFESVNVETVVKELKEEHGKVTEDLLKEYDLPEGITESDWIILASIVEKEADTADSRRRVADILLRRLEEGMPLQVDATFVYGVQKNSFTLTLDDLKEDHEYNTYTRTGLPPTPISNPGEDAMRAVLEPIPNKAVYFLTGLDGEMYYANTYEDHLKNRKLYLDK